MTWDARVETFIPAVDSLFSRRVLRIHEMLSRLFWNDEAWSAGRRAVLGFENDVDVAGRDAGPPIAGDDGCDLDSEGSTRKRECKWLADCDKG